MGHVPDGVLRRLDDEPLAVPDSVIEHLARCERCGLRHEEIARDAERAAGMLAAPAPQLDTETAWARLEARLVGGSGGPRPRRARRGAAVAWRRPLLPIASLRTALAIGGIAVVVAGTAAAATLTTVFAPTHVAPVSLSQGDLRAIATLTGLGDTRVPGGFSTPVGTSRARFGTIRWWAGQPRPAASPAAAAARAGFRVPLPVRFPAGVGRLRQLIVQPRARATVRFNASATGLEGSSVTIDAGPAVLAVYAADGGSDLPALGVVTMRRPTAVSVGATMSRIEGFLLRQPGIPPQLAEEVRLLGDLRTALPVPVPPGVSTRSVRVGVWRGVLLADPANGVAGVIWEDGGGMLHLVAGLLDSRDVLNVAGQLG